MYEEINNLLNKEKIPNPIIMGDAKVGKKTDTHETSIGHFGIGK